MACLQKMGKGLIRFANKKQEIFPSPVYPCSLSYRTPHHNIPHDAKPYDNMRHNVFSQMA